MVILRQLYQMPDGHFVGAAFLSCIHSLRGAEVVGDFLLSFIGIFSKISDARDIIHTLAYRIII